MLPSTSSGITDKDKNEESNLKRNPSLWSCDFEAAIDAAGFGKFNIFLMITVGITGLICVLESRSSAYIVPAAQCDLHLDINKKATLGSVSLIGMVATSFFWGLMSDLLGRKKLILVICLLDFSCWLLGFFSNSYEMVLVARLLGGMVSSGLYPNLAVYLSELHGVKHRSIVQLFLGNIYGLGDLLLPLLALGVLTNDDEYEISGFVFHPWNTYMLVISIIPFLSGIMFILLPESPKFLMSKSENEKAFDVFKSIYTSNSKRESEIEYPVKSLTKTSKEVFNNLELPLEERTNGCLPQMKQFLEMKHFKNLIVAILSQFFIILGLNSFILWLPQIFQEMNNHNRFFNESGTLCESLDRLQTKTNEFIDECEEDFKSNMKIYVSCIIVALATIIIFAICSLIVNRIGKKTLLYFLGTFSAVFVMLLLLSDNFIKTILIAAIICGFGNMGFNTLTAIVADIFPTHLRTMSVSLTMMFGKLGGALGSYVFPIFLQFGCWQALFFIAAVDIVGVFLAYFLSNTIEDSETPKPNTD